MLNKILVYGGVSLAAILVIENMVIASGTAYIFLIIGDAGTLSIISVIIGGIIGYGIKGLIYDNKKYAEVEDNDF